MSLPHALRCWASHWNTHLHQWLHSTCFENSGCPSALFHTRSEGSTKLAFPLEKGKEPREGAEPSGEAVNHPGGTGSQGQDSRCSREREQDPVETPWMLSGASHRQKILLGEASACLSLLITAPTWPGRPLSLAVSLPSVRRVLLAGKRFLALPVPIAERLTFLKGEESHCIYYPFIE